MAGKSETGAGTAEARLTGDDGDERDATDDLQEAAPSALGAGRQRRECAGEAGTGEHVGVEADAGALDLNDRRDPG